MPTTSGPLEVVSEKDHADAPFFSIVTVSLNAASHIGEAIDSVVAQTYDDYEYVVVDGGSMDQTLEILQRSESQLSGRLRWRSEPDNGLYDAMNKGLQRARGEYVVFLGADDRLAPGALASVKAALAQHPDADIVCGATRVFGERDEWREPPRSYRDSRIPKRAPARHQSIYCKRDRLLSVGGFNTRYSIAADYDLYLKLIEAGATEVLLEAPLSEFRLGGVSSAAAMPTAREYFDVRVAHGASRLVQRFVLLKSVAAAAAFRWSRGVVAAWRRS